jgi:HSP20 family protein
LRNSNYFVEENGMLHSIKCRLWREEKSSACHKNVILVRIFSKQISIHQKKEQQMNIVEPINKFRYRLVDGWRIILQSDSPVTKFTPAKHEDDVAKKQSSEPVRWAVMAADVRELNDELFVTLDAPGLDRQRVNIQLEGNQLLITGEKPAQLSNGEISEPETEQGKWHIHERAYGHFERKIPLPVEVSHEAATAEYKEGVLSLHIPKKIPEPEPSQAVGVTIRLEGAKSESSSSKSKGHS